MLLMLSTLNTITVNSSETIYLKCNNNRYPLDCGKKKNNLSETLTLIT